MRNDLPLEAREMAISAPDARIDGLVHRSDAARQYTAIRYTGTLTDAGALPQAEPRPPTTLEPRL